MFKAFVFVTACVLSSAFAMDPDPEGNEHAIYGAEAAGRLEVPAAAAVAGDAGEEPADDARVIDSAVDYLGRWNSESPPEEDDEMLVPQG